jgi:glycerol uptake facilitator protein
MGILTAVKIADCRLRQNARQQQKQRFSMTTALQQPSLSSQCMAEFLGTALLIFFGTGCVAALKVAGASFGLWEISIIWGIGVSMAIYLSAGISGAHLNPAVSIALCIFADFDKRKLPFYIIAQVAGAFCSAALVYTLYSNLFFDYEQTHHMIRGTQASLELASVFSTYPHPLLGTAQAFLVEMVITAILMGVIMALTDDNNGLPRGPLAPLLIGLLIAVIGSAMGPLTGFAMNPARDFGPKLMTFFAGWGEMAFTGGRDIPYFLIPIFAPIVGACLGAAAYRGLIARHLPSAAPATTDATEAAASGKTRTS